MIGEHIVDSYAQRIVAGLLPAGKYHRLACVRHLNDRQREATDPTYPFRFDIAAAERFFRFSAKLKHYKGEWAGQPIALSDFQKFRLGCVFGWRQRDSGLRRFTTAYNELPRKTGKSLEAAVVSLYVTFYEGEPGAEGYCIATKEKQACVVFGDIKQLVQSSGLKSRLKVQAKNIHREDTASKLEPLGSDSDTTDGLSPQLICTDEFHAFKTRGLVDVMESATGSRRNPLHYQITTAGNDPVSPCGDQHDYACKILDGVLDDFATQSFFACIAHADVEDDWLSEDTWKKANPHYGISVKPEDMLKLALKAKEMPSAAAEFKQKRLNLWVNADQPWLSLEGWRRGQSAGMFNQPAWAEDLLHQSCWAGVDLASKLDLCALVLLFPPTATRSRWRILRWVWAPEELLTDRARRDRAPYDVWAQQGVLLTTPGPRIDHSAVRRKLVELRALYDIEAIGFDPWHADKLIDELVTVDGFGKDQVLEVPQTYASISSAALNFEAEVVEGKMDAGGCPLMAWCVSNAVVQRDGKDNIYPVKKRSRGRIDPVMATIIARRLAIVSEPQRPSIYESQDVMTI